MKMLYIFSLGTIATICNASEPQWSDKSIVGAYAASLPQNSQSSNATRFQAWQPPLEPLDLKTEEQKQRNRGMSQYRTVALSSPVVPSAPFLNYPPLPPYCQDQQFTSSESLYDPQKLSSDFQDIPLEPTESVHGQKTDEMIRLGRENLDKALESFTQCFSAIKDDFEKAAQAYIEQSNVQLDTSTHHEEKKRSLFATVAYKSRVLLKGKEEAEIHEQKNALKKQIKSNSLLKEEAQKALVPLIVKIGAITNGVSKIQEAVTKGKEETSQKQADIRERRMSQSQSPATPIQHRKSSYNLSQTPPSPHTMRSGQFK